MKNNNLIIIGGLALVAFLLMKKQPAPVDPGPILPLPPMPSSGDLSVTEKLNALKYYSDTNNKNYGSALNKMSETELLDFYSYIFEYPLSGKRIPDWLTNRVKLIALKYGFKL